MYSNFLQTSIGGSQKLDFNYASRDAMFGTNFAYGGQFSWSYLFSSYEILEFSIFLSLLVMESPFSEKIQDALNFHTCKLSIY